MSVEVKVAPKREMQAQKGVRFIALLTLNRGSRRRWLVKAKHRPIWPQERFPAHIAEEVGKALGPLRTGLEKRKPVRPATGESLYPLQYPGLGAVSISAKISNFRNITHIQKLRA